MSRPGLTFLTPARREVWSRAATHALCGFAPIFFTFYMVAFSAAQHAFAYDFDRAFWPAGAHVLHGSTPYASPTSFAATHGFAFVYPAPGALLFAAFAWMPRVAADILFTAICISATFGTLRILGVRDWRIYGLTLLWAPVVSGWQTANLSLLLALGIAIAWKYRDRPVIAGATVGLMISLKLFLWPLIGWLLLTRRWRAAAWAAISALVMNIASWAVVGFSQINAYTDLVRAVTKVEEVTAYTPLALALRVGAGRALADVIAALVVVAVGYVTFRCARERRESAVLLGVITISLLATPIVWRHYFVLFLVPLAIARPRLSPLWAIPVVMLPFPVTGPSIWQLLVMLGAMGFLVYALFRWPRPVSWTQHASTPRANPVVAMQGSGAPVSTFRTVDSTSARS